MKDEKDYLSLQSKKNLIMTNVWNIANIQRKITSPNWFYKVAPCCKVHRFGENFQKLAIFRNFSFRDGLQDNCSKTPSSLWPQSWLLIHCGAFICKKIMKWFGWEWIIMQNWHGFYSFQHKIMICFQTLVNIWDSRDNTAHFLSSSTLEDHT